MTEVLVADGDAAVRGVIVSTFTRVGLDVEVFDSGRPLLEAALAERPVAIVAEIELPDISGYEVCRELQDAYGPSLPVVLVSGRRVEPVDRVAGLLIGAHDYLVKPLDADELLVRVRRLIEPNGGRPDATPPGPPLAGLTKREREVLMLLAAGHRQAEIADELVISAKTAGTHIQRILEKLGVHSRAEAVAVVYGADPHRGHPAKDPENDQSPGTTGACGN